jgi:membrane peptidoglycan carboxypeptidase
MKQVVCCGTGTVANDGMTFDIFGKTGTTDDDSDVWFCGGTTEVVACVWVGHPEGRVPMPGATGGTVAAPIWNEFYLQIAKDIDPERYPAPEITGELIHPSPVPAPSPAPTQEPEEEEDEGGPKPSPKPPPTTPPAPPPTTPPAPPPTTEPPPTPPPTP